MGALIIGKQRERQPSKRFPSPEQRISEPGNTGSCEKSYNFTKHPQRRRFSAFPASPEIAPNETLAICNFAIRKQKGTQCKLRLAIAQMSGNPVSKANELHFGRFRSSSWLGTMPSCAHFKSSGGLTQTSNFYPGTPNITSDALMTAKAILPSANSSNVAEVLVMVPTISTPGAISRVTSQLTAPSTTLTTFPFSMLLSLLCTVGQLF